MTEFFRALQNSAFSTWVVSSDSFWAYPMILTMHTVGLAIVVGAAIVIDLRLLGVGAQIPIAEMRGTFRIFWLGFMINLLSGLALFVSEAADKAAQPVFLVKLTLIAIAVVATTRTRRVVRQAGEPVDQFPAGARALAAASLVLWAGAVVTGRLMAYL